MDSNWDNRSLDLKMGVGQGSWLGPAEDNRLEGWCMHVHIYYIFMFIYRLNPRKTVQVNRHELDWTNRKTQLYGGRMCEALQRVEEVSQNNFKGSLRQSDSQDNETVRELESQTIVDSYLFCSRAGKLERQTAGQVGSFES